RLSQAINAHLRPLPVAVLDCVRVPDGWHARFSATERRYVYRVMTRRAPLTHQAGLVWRVPVRLERAAMQAGADRLLGRHDFTSFRSTACQANNALRTLVRLDVTELPCADGQEFRFDVVARSFLHNQVRSMV